MQSFDQFITTVSNLIWGPPAILVLIGTGLLLSIRTRFVQFRKLGLGLEIVRGKYDDPGIRGDVTHFQALSTALAATIGTGNIVGVATAIAVGGPGAVFWMWLTALVGMATKFSSCLLALRYRTLDAKGQAIGGPMVTLERGLGFKKLGRIFAVCTVASALGIGNLVQSHSAAAYLYTSFSIPKWFTGALLAFLVALVIIGGIRRIAHVTSRLVPFMCLFYVAVCLVVLVLRSGMIPAAFGLIFQHAFTPLGATGGFVGSTVLLTMRMGVARGIFSNESGLGSAPIAHAAAKTKEPVREGLVAMLGPFIDTIIICTLTALVIITTGAWSGGLDGAALSAAAFRDGFFGWGDKLVAIALALFAYSTILGWFYYGDRALSTLTGGAWPHVYKWLWTLLIPLGALTQLRLVWNLADIANGFMAIPNLISLIALSGVVAKATDEYFKRVKKVTPLVGTHERMNAKLTDFHGWYLPIQYSSIIEEHRAVREAAGLFDTSHLGKVRVTGPDAHSFVQRITTGDSNRLTRGRILYTLVTNERGGILDDILVYCHSRTHYFLVTNAAHHERLMRWFRRHRFSQARIQDETDRWALLALQGPRAVDALEPFLNSSYRKLKTYTFEENRFAKKIPVMVSRTGYTGEDGFELFIPSHMATWAWNTLLGEKQKVRILPAGLGARDSLRLEAGNLLSGQDFDSNITPFEAGLAWTVHFDKPFFLGRAALMRAKNSHANRRIAGFAMTGHAIPRTGNRVFKGKKEIGRVTSGSFSPTLKKPIGFVFVDTDCTEPGTGIQIIVRGKSCPAKIVKKPFVTRKKRKELQKNGIPG